MLSSSWLLILAALKRPLLSRYEFESLKKPEAMKRILILLLLGILCIAGARALTGSTPPASESEAARSATNSGDLVPITSSASSSEPSRSANPETSARTTSTSSSNLPPKPPSDSLNTPGEDFDFSSYLKNGRVSIVYFYADWCPSCREISPVMARINSSDPNTQVLFLNIGEWNTPIADRYDVRYVPYFRVYDESGSLIADGRSATSWVQNKFPGL